MNHTHTPKLSGKSKGKKPSAPAKPMETGTAGDDVDYEWIPRSALRTPGSNRCDYDEVTYDMELAICHHQPNQM